MKTTKSKKHGKKRAGVRKKLSPIDKFLALSDAEKDAEVAEFDKGIVPSQWRPLNAAERKQWARIKRKMAGRPIVGRGSRMVAVSMERGLLQRADRYAKAHSLKRAQMIAQALELFMQRKSG